jgi:subtilisin
MGTCLAGPVGGVEDGTIEPLAPMHLGDAMDKLTTNSGPRPNYILLPRNGVQPRSYGRESGAVLRRLPRSVSTQPAVTSCTSLLLGATEAPMVLVDAIRETGGKLVAIEPHVAAAIARSSPLVRMMPLVTYALPERALRSGGEIPPAPAASLLPATLTLVCRDAKTGKPLEGCEVEAYVDFARGKGGQGKTDATGQLTLSLTTGWVERLYIKASSHHWGAYRTGVAAGAGPVVLDIAPVDPSAPDVLRRIYPNTRFNPAAGVKVGVIDTGLGPHPDLNVEHNENTVTGEPKFDGQDWAGHGTHVAGIIGAKGAAGGPRGMAPGVALRGYRVFGAQKDDATNYSILKAIINAVEDGCDIINLSLGDDQPDEVVAEGILDARNQGALVVVAGGNGRRGPIDYPAAYAGATAVIAMGVRGSIPDGCYDSCHLATDPPSSFYADDYVAAFSDYGPRVSVIAPGVGVVSTIPGGGYAPLSGTSMAAPVVAGAAACLLSNAPAIHALDRNRERSDLIEKMLLTACRSRGFPREYEGAGMPDPSLI